MSKGQPRKKAKEAGEKYYHGSACKICGGTERFVTSGACRKDTAHRWAARTEEEKQRYRVQNRVNSNNYRKRNLDRYAEWMREYREKNRDKMRTYMREYMREYRRKQSGCKTERDD